MEYTLIFSTILHVDGIYPIIEQNEKKVTRLNSVPPIFPTLFLMNCLRGEKAAGCVYC